MDAGILYVLCILTGTSLFTGSVTREHDTGTGSATREQDAGTGTATPLPDVRTGNSLIPNSGSATRFPDCETTTRLPEVETGSATQQTEVKAESVYGNASETRNRRNATLATGVGNITWVPETEMDTRKTLWLQGLFELSGGCRSGGQAELDAVRLALEHVNARGIVPGYRILMHADDTRCDAGIAVDAFFQALYRRPRMTAILGPALSETTERLSRVVTYWNVPHVSFGALASSLSQPTNQANFSSFFRTVSPDVSHHRARLQLLRHFRWDTVGALYQDDDQNTLSMNELIRDLEEANVTVAATVGLTHQDYVEQLAQLKEKDFRIIIASISTSLLKKVFCEVNRLGMDGNDYVWLLSEPEEPWWLEPGCSGGARLGEGFISVARHVGDSGPDSTSGLSPSQLSSMVSGSSPFLTEAYDAVWTVSLALKESLPLPPLSSSLEHEANEPAARTLSAAILNTSFQGVSGPISFRGPDRIGTTAFYQNQGGDLVRVALYHPQSDSLNFTCPQCRPVRWKGSDVPVARRVVRLRPATVQAASFVLITSLALTGMALAIGFLSFNLYFRNRKYIKLSSPNLNNTAVAGCLLVYLGVVLLGLDSRTLHRDSHFPIVCTARAYLFSGGFCLAFGSMFIKTYRVHHIFIRANTGIIKSKLLQDQQLIGLVGALVLVDCIIVTVWVSVDPMERQLRNLTAQESREERDVVYVFQREQCHSPHMAKWLGVLYAYKGLLLAVGCYMAWETRQVKIPALNDSQYIGLSVYNVVLTSVLVVALANVISVERYGLTFLLVSSLILVSTTTTLCLLFLPKILRLVRNPDGDAVVASTGMKVESNTRRFLVDEKREVVFRAEIQNRVYHTELFELDSELCRLRGLTDYSDLESEDSSVSSPDEDQQPDHFSQEEISSSDFKMLERPSVGGRVRPSFFERLRRVSNSWDTNSDQQSSPGGSWSRRGHNKGVLKEGKALHTSKLYSVRPLNEPRRNCFHLSLSGQLVQDTDVATFRHGSSPILAYRTATDEEDDEGRTGICSDAGVSPWPSSGSFGDSEYFSVLQGLDSFQDTNSYTSSDTVTWWTAPPNHCSSSSVCPSMFSLQDPVLNLNEKGSSLRRLQEPVFNLQDNNFVFIDSAALRLQDTKRSNMDTELQDNRGPVFSLQDRTLCYIEPRVVLQNRNFFSQDYGLQDPSLLTQDAAGQKLEDNRLQDAGFYGQEQQDHGNNMRESGFRGQNNGCNFQDCGFTSQEDSVCEDLVKQKEAILREIEQLHAVEL